MNIVTQQSQSIVSFRNKGEEKFQNVRTRLKSLHERGLGVLLVKTRQIKTHPARDRTHTASPFLFKILRTCALFAIISPVLPISAGNNDPVGAKSAGIAHASVTLADEWSSFNNQAGLGYIPKPTIGLYFENRFQVKEFSLKAGTFAYPLKPATLALSYRHFGYSKYHESKVGLGIGRKFTEYFAVGVQIDYLQTYFAEGYGTYNAVAAEAGLLAKPLKGLRIGFHVYNFTRNNNNSLPEESIPTNVRLGISYEIERKATILLEAEKELESNVMIKAGLDLNPVNNLFFRLGFATQIEQYSVGIGYKLKRISADIAFSHNAILGFSPKAGISFEF
ncbi:MAG TPA: hypothetical protein VHO72_07290 [Bacteroidales bacterium]|nr:hypothetical protein [Bacteroidales bacterium]